MHFLSLIYFERLACIAFSALRFFHFNKKKKFPWLLPSIRVAGALLKPGSETGTEHFASQDSSLSQALKLFVSNSDRILDNIKWWCQDKLKRKTPYFLFVVFGSKKSRAQAPYFMNAHTGKYGAQLVPLYCPHQILFIQHFWHDFCFSFCLFSTARLSWHDFSPHHFFLHDFFGTTFLARLFWHHVLLAPLFWHDFLLARLFLAILLARLFRSSKKYTWKILGDIC